MRAAVIPAAILSVATTFGTVDPAAIPKETTALQHTLQDTREQLRRSNYLLRQILQTTVADKSILSTTVTATAYSASALECDGSPETTAMLTPSRVGVVAISRDLETEIGLHLGQFIIIKGLGLFRVEDRMARRWRRRIDILHGNRAAARLFGTRRVEIIWLQ